MKEDTKITLHNTAHRSIQENNKKSISNNKKLRSHRASRFHENEPRVYMLCRNE